MTHHDQQGRSQDARGDIETGMRLLSGQGAGEIIISTTGDNETPTDHECRLAQQESERPEPDDEDG